MTRFAAVLDGRRRFWVTPTSSSQLAPHQELPTAVVDAPTSHPVIALRPSTKDWSRPAWQANRSITRRAPCPSDAHSTARASRLARSIGSRPINTAPAAPWATIARRAGTPAAVMAAACSSRCTISSASSSRPTSTGRTPAPTPASSTCRSGRPASIRSRVGRSRVGSALRVSVQWAAATGTAWHSPRAVASTAPISRLPLDRI